MTAWLLSKKGVHYNIIMKVNRKTGVSKFEGYKQSSNIFEGRGGMRVNIGCIPWNFLSILFPYSVLYREKNVLIRFYYFFVRAYGVKSVIVSINTGIIGIQLWVNLSFTPIMIVFIEYEFKVYQIDTGLFFKT